MTFKDPSLIDLKKTIKNNKKLEKVLSDNHILITIEDYYELYGYDENKKFLAKFIVEEENDKVYENIASVLLDDIDYIKQTSVSQLVNEAFKKKELVIAFGFVSTESFPRKIYAELFYAVKYCYVSSFFQNNWENFLPTEDFTTIKNNECADAFLDAIMKEFDKLNNIITDSKKFNSYEDIPYEYIVYLTQLLGLEQKTFFFEEEQAKQYRLLAKNILDVYAVKGSRSSFELLFNMLGYDVSIQEYYFDRRKLFEITDINSETSSNDKTTYSYYLTENNPCLNLLNGIATNESVREQDLTETKNVFDFDDLVIQYGLNCVLGYSDSYIKNGIEKKYTGETYTYFKTNYIKISPTLKFSSKNLTIQQNYQVKALVDFLLPEFKQMNIYVKVNISDDINDVDNDWAEDGRTGFHIWDSETRKQDFSDKFISNYNEYAESEFTILPKRIDDLGREKYYYNSVPENQLAANGEYKNVFMDPISEKIKIINTTKYWGDKVKSDSLLTKDLKNAGFTEEQIKKKQKLYPVYRIDEKYNIGNGDVRNPYITKQRTNLEGQTVTEKIVDLYIPRDLDIMVGHSKEEWDNIEKIDLNGYYGKNLRNLIKEMNENLVAVKKIDVATSLSLANFLNENFSNTTEEELTKKQDFFEKGWQKSDNYIWKFVKNISEDKLQSFIDSHNNIINYDYLNKRLFTENKLYNIDFSQACDSFTITGKETSNDDYAENLLKNLSYEFNYFISYKDNKYSIYQFSPVRSHGINFFRDTRAVPISTQRNSYYTFDNYVSLKNSLSSGKFIHNGEITSVAPDMAFYVTDEDIYYKQLTLTTNITGILREDVNKIKKISTERNNTVGSFYLFNAFEYDEEAIISDKKDFRVPKIYRYRNKNIKKGELIFSAADEKIYEVINSSVYYIPSYTSSNGETISDSFYGIREFDLHGKLKLVDGVYYICEYDDSYKGFSEKDDIDNFILRNTSNTAQWKEHSYTGRPIKDFIDLQQDEVDDILKEILKEFPTEKNTFEGVVLQANGKELRYTSKKQISLFEYHPKELTTNIPMTVTGKSITFKTIEI